MKINRLPDYLGHMRQAIADAQAFTEGMAQPDFEQDKRTQQAVVMSLIVLGEAATKIMDQHPEFAAEHAEIPWRSMRNRIAVISTSTLPWSGTLCKRLYQRSKFSSIPSFQSEPGSEF